MPTAPEGKLCVYTAEEGGEGFVFASIAFNHLENKYEPAGSVLRFFHEDGESSLNINGSWAVTAP